MIKSDDNETVSHKTPQLPHNPSHQVVSTNQPLDLLMFILAVGLATVITALSVGVGNVLHKGQLIEKLVYGK